MFYELGCETFKVNGEPDLRNKENKVMFGPDGLNINKIKENAVKDFLKRRSN